jgi:tRNA U54 and U55 pseudouridine synthase Pus10
MKKNKKKFEKKIMKLKGKKKVGLCFAIYINCTCGMYIKDKINMKKN